ncbi:MAG: radical SAM protein [Anaerolineaceae bacterium]|nr:radical SAM protein [Anaerolineaceae bacterium]
MLKYVYGPVPSRRLGQSLGIDPVPLKTCNWNCVYCQLGRTRPLTNKRSVFFPPEDIISQVKEALKAHKPGEIDWITFVGSGETMLNSSIGWLICEVKTLTRIPVAVITNGSLLYLPEVRQELATADAVLPSLDAGNAKLYQQINRPYPELTFETLVDGLIAFREEYKGKYWMEVMLVRGMNDSEKALKEITSILARIKPDEIHIVQPDRPPVETWVQPTGEEGLIRARAILGDIAKVIHPISGSFDLSGYGNLVDAIVGIITRHPMRESELVETLKKWSSKDVSKTLAALESSGKAQVIIRYGVRFWSASPAFYPDT